MLGETRLTVRVRVDGERTQGPRLDADFDSAASTTAVMGPSGAGKSTLLQCVAGLIRPSAGRITIDDEVVFDSDARIFVPAHQRRVALVFQSLALFPHLSVWQNVVFGVRRGTRRERRDAAMAWLERTRVSSLASRMPATLSGGEAQRVALARAMASEPRLLLLDEPFSALNQELRLALGEVLRDLFTAARVPMLLATHDEADARRMASRILTLQAGRLTESEMDGD